MTLILLKTKRFADERGWFSETWSRSRCAERGIINDFCQDNHSYSRHAGTLRGIHFQRPPFAQAKLVRCIRGRIFDIAVDLRRESPTFGRWLGVTLDAHDGNQLLIPAGYGHAFLTLESDCEVSYKVDNPYAATADGGVAWNDEDIAVDWPAGAWTGDGPVLSAKDAALPGLGGIDFSFAYDGHPMTLTEIDL